MGSRASARRRSAPVRANPGGSAAGRPRYPAWNGPVLELAQTAPAGTRSASPTTPPRAKQSAASRSPPPAGDRPAPATPRPAPAGQAPAAPTHTDTAPLAALRWAAAPCPTAWNSRRSRGTGESTGRSPLRDVEEVEAQVGGGHALQGEFARKAHPVEPLQRGPGTGPCRSGRRTPGTAAGAGTRRTPSRPSTGRPWTAGSRTRDTSPWEPRSAPRGRPSRPPPTANCLSAEHTSIPFSAEQPRR